MSLNLQEMRDELRDVLGVDDEDMPNARTDRYLNLAWWEVADKYNFLEKERESSISTVDGTRDYSTPVSIDAIQRLFITPDETGETPVHLKQMGKDVYAEKYIDNDDAKDEPTHYLSWDHNTIRLYPTPDDEYVITIEYLITLDDLDSGGPIIPQSWHEIILQGAIWRGWRWLKASDRILDMQV
jgi:hypothetical protein